MALEELRRRFGFEEKRAKDLGMTVEQYREAKKKLKAEEGKQRVEFEKWKIKRKYQQKRKITKSGRKRSFSATLNQIQKNLETFGGPGLFAQPATRKRKKKSKKRKKKR